MAIFITPARAERTSAKIGFARSNWLASAGLFSGLGVTNERAYVGYLMITHDISLACEFADRVAVMH